MNNRMMDLLAQNPEQAPQLLSGLDHHTLYQMRRGATNQMQNLLSPYEHRAYAREATADNPLMGVSIATSVPLYQLYKSLIPGSRSQPSMEQVKQGLLGVGEGFEGWMKGLLPK